MYISVTIPITYPDHRPHIMHAYTLHGVHTISFCPNTNTNSSGRYQRRGMIATDISTVEIVNYHLTICSTFYSVTLNTLVAKKVVMKLAIIPNAVIINGKYMAS